SRTGLRETCRSSAPCSSPTHLRTKRFETPSVLLRRPCAEVGTERWRRQLALQRLPLARGPRCVGLRVEPLRHPGGAALVGEICHDDGPLRRPDPDLELVADTHLFRRL